MDNISKGNNLETRKALAAALEVHPMTIVKWEQQGMPIASRGSKGRPSLYDREAVTAWRNAREVAAREESNGPLDPVQERAKKEKFQALLAEQTFLTRQRKLLPADEVERIWRGEVTAVRALVLTSYTTHADRVFRAGQLHGLAGVERELKALAYEILRELASPDRPLPPHPDETPITEPVAGASIPKSRRKSRRKTAA